ncbi:MAG: MATE family efflux transporter [Myxococcales bacterium]|nr:MATE family efflux transporter [Myxococcales bacterium]
MSKLVNESLPKTIAKMAVPMLAGTFALNTYQLTNAWFVSRLGTESLAAISFAYPVIMFILFLARGLSSGAMTLVAHALGRQDQHEAATLTTHALGLTLLFAALVTLVGLLTVRPVFARLGAAGEVLEMTARYMRIWYLGAPIMLLQVVAADVIISTGNTKIISLLMVGSTGLNIFFDLGLIFGRFGLPRMGIAGAALATILAQSAILAAACFILARRLGLIELRLPAWRELMRSWGRILKFGVPGALGLVLTPISSAVITRLVAGYGTAAVAALGVAGRIEMFAFMIPMTVGMSLIPLAAQNYGAGRLDRIRAARKGTMLFAAGYGVFIGLTFIFFADSMARIFSAEAAVVDVLKSYIYITCMGYGMLEVNRYAGFVMTGAQEPLKASLLNIIRVLVLLIPLSLLGSALFHLRGIFFGRLVTDLTAGTIGIWWSGRVLSAKAARRGEA